MALRFEVCPTDGACRAGDLGRGAGQLSFPGGLTLDGASNLYVADSGNNRISVFDSAGPSFIRAFGWDVADPDGDAAFEVCPTEGACRPGDFGSAAGQLDAPFGIAIECPGAVWVADTDNGRLQRFGEPGTALPPCRATTPPVSAAGAPSNAFTIGKLRGRKLSLSVSSAGVVSVTDAGSQAAGSDAIAAARKLLRPSSASGGPGVVVVRLRLTKAARQTLRRKGKVKVSATITFTPTGGTPDSQNRKLKIKK